MSQFSTEVAYFANAGPNAEVKLYKDLRDYAAKRSPHLLPKRAWQGYYANSLGFYDKEFQGNSGIRRVAALGDSFVYGLVSYPLNVQTLVEGILSDRCQERLEVMNLGVPASGLWDYKTVLELVSTEFLPSAFAIHLYLGNDPPDLLHEFDDLPNLHSGAWHSYLFRYLRNSSLIWQFTITKPQDSITPGSVPDGPGGTAVNNPPLTSVGVSHYTEEGYLRVLEDELGRLFSATVKQGRRWQRFFDTLRKMRDFAVRTNRPFLVVLYPSRLQVEPALFNLVVERVVSRRAAVTPRDFDPLLPNHRILEFCTSEQISCLDLTPEFQRFYQATRHSLYIDKDVHWNEHGNRLAAEEEGKWLSHLLCKTPPG